MVGWIWMQLLSNDVKGSFKKLKRMEGPQRQKLPESRWKHLTYAYANANFSSFDVKLNLLGPFF